MEQEGLKFHTYKYYPKNVVLTVGSTNYTYEDGSITYINIIHDYHAKRLPVIQLGMEMETAVIQEVYNNINNTSPDSNVRLKFDIYEYEYDMSEKVVNTSLYLQQTLTVIPARDKTTYITATDSDTTKITDVMKTLQNFEMYLIDMDKVKWFTQEIDAIFDSASYSAMLQAMFVMRNIPSSVIIATPPEQTGIVNNISIPIEDLIHNIRFINTEYGLYDTVPIIYYDMEYLYCLSKRAPNILIDSATDYGTVTFVLINPEKASHNVTGSCNDSENKTHWINLNSEPNVYSTETADTSTKVSTVTAVDQSGTVSKTTLDNNASTMRYVYANNGLSASQVINESMTGPTVALTVINTCVRFVKPYKDYTFVSDTSYQDKKLDGKIYRLTRLVHGIHREGRTDYITELSMVLYTPTRVSDNPGTNG